MPHTVPRNKRNALYRLWSPRAHIVDSTFSTCCDRLCCYLSRSPFPVHQAACGRAELTSVNILRCVPDWFQVICCCDTLLKIQRATGEVPCILGVDLFLSMIKWRYHWGLKKKQSAHFPPDEIESCEHKRFEERKNSLE